MTLQTTDNGQPPAVADEKPGARFKRLVTHSATGLLDEWVGPERAAEAKGRVIAAFQAAALSAKNPQDFYDCTPSSVAYCVAISALTGIMPSTGAMALAYVRPQRARRGEPPGLMYSLSHRGIVALAKRAGLTLIPLACGTKDRLVMQDGEVSTFEPDIDDPPLTWEELRGVVVIVKDAKTGTTLFRGWVARKIIEARRAVSQAYQYAAKPGNEWAQATDPWHAWPVEQAMKTGLHYAGSRGWVVIDDTEAIRALAADIRADAIDVDFEPSSTPQPTGHAALGLPAPPLAEDIPARQAEPVPVTAAHAAEAAAVARARQDGPRVTTARECVALEAKLSEDEQTEARNQAQVDAEYAFKPCNGMWPLADLERYLVALRAMVASKRNHGGREPDDEEPE